jgi:outer membrane protein assembly factor BamA
LRSFYIAYSFIFLVCVPSKSLGQGLVVGRIFIDRINVFDPTFSDQRHLFYKTVNRLHIVTREPVIARELLFKEGDSFDPKLLEESERNLRELSLFRSVHIFPLPEKNGVIDVVVQAQDAWSTEPQFNLKGTSEGAETALGLLERNLLGYGKTASVFYDNETTRESLEFRYFDPRLFSSRYRLNLRYETRSDGFFLSSRFDRPFYALHTPWAMTLLGAGLDQTDALYESGDAVSSFNQQTRLFETLYSRKIAESGDAYHRLSFSYLYEDDDFTQTVSTDPDSFPEDRRFGRFGLTYQRIEDGFMKVDYINAFEREEDVNLGNSFIAFAGYSPEILGGDQDRQFFLLSDSQGYPFGSRHFILAGASISGRPTAGVFENTIQAFRLRYYYYFVTLLRQTLALHVEEVASWHLDKEDQLTLGGSTGLRGYPERQFTGNKSLLFAVEDRIFFLEDFFHVVSPGAVVFFDSGYVWSEGEGFDLQDLKSDVGFGFRFGFTRSSSVNVLRLDFAWALNEVDGEQGFVFSFGSSQSF